MAKRISKNSAQLTYKSSGVDIDANDEMVSQIKRSMRRTYDPRVISRHGGFAGLMRLDFQERLLRRRYREPVLVAGADGVGSKLLLALEANRVADLGIDLVAMNVNDVLTTGAEPLFLLDYIACHKLVPAQIAEIVDGISRGCKMAGCALLGGETAEMPALYAPTHFDLAAFCVGVVERRRIIDGSLVRPGDAVIGLASSGIHSNGYSLVRAALQRAGSSLPQRIAINGRAGRNQAAEEPLMDALLRPTRIYARSIHKLLAAYRRKRVVRAMAHITGGGLEGNIPRVIPRGCRVRLARGSWPIPPVLSLIQSLGVDEAEMYRVFNMGIGFVLVVRPSFAQSIISHLRRLGEKAYRIGDVIQGRPGLEWADSATQG